MNPSYDNSFGSFSSGGTSGGAIQQQQPIVINNGKAKKPVKKILITILLIVLVVAVIVGVVVIMKNRQKKLDEDFQEYYSLLMSFSSAGQCSSVSQDVDNVNRVESEYEEILKLCQKNADRIQELTNNLENAKGSTEYKTFFASVKTLVSNNLSSGQELEGKLKIYEAWHNWRLSVEGAEDVQLPDDVDKIAEILTKTEVPVLVQHAEQWKEKRNDLIMAYVFKDALSEGFNYQDDYAKKLEDYNEFMSRGLEEVYSSLGFNMKDGDELREAANSLYKSYYEGML